jgi:hypothetical protein
LSVVTPFTDPTQSLSEQLESLAMTTHLIFVLYHNHGTSFISGQLFHDLQAMIKNLYFCIAKQQILDPFAPFYLSHLGSDRLEILFGTIRTLIHDRNVDALQLADRLTAAFDIVEILGKYPEWDQGHRRLKLQGAEGVDHVNPASWIGDVSVNNVSLQTTWRKGWDRASAALSTAGIVFNFHLVEAVAGIDMFRPRGGDKYTGVGTLEPKDTSIPEFPINPVNPAPASSHSESVESQHTGDSDSEPIDDDEALDLEDVLDNTHNDETELVPLDQVAPVKLADRDWLELHEEGRPVRRVHKASVIRILLSPKAGVNSTDRLRRVHGYTRALLPTDSNSDEVTGPDTFSLGNLIATLVLVEDQMSLAVVQVTGIDRNKERLSSIPAGDFSNTSSKIQLSGQILDMRKAGSKWTWTGDYAYIPPKQSALNKSSQKSLVFKFAATLVQIINPEIIDNRVSIHSLCNTKTRRELTKTWAFEETELSFLHETLWENTQGQRAVGTAVTQLAKCSKSFPYRQESGMHFMV